MFPPTFSLLLGIFVNFQKHEEHLFQIEDKYQNERLTSDGMLLLVVVSGEAPHVAHVGLAVVVVLQPLPVPHQRLALSRSLHVVPACCHIIY